MTVPGSPWAPPPPAGTPGAGGIPAVGGAPVADGTPGQPGWWRRNWVGLLVLPVCLTAALAVPLRTGYETYWPAKPRLAVTGTPGGTATLDGAQLRLDELTRSTTITDYDGRPAVPDSMRVWQVTVTIDAPDRDAVSGCELRLVDAAGNRYGMNPSELSSTKVGFEICAPDTTAADTGTFQVRAHFVLPASAQPTAVEVDLASRLPRYALLLPG